MFIWKATLVFLETHIIAVVYLFIIITFFIWLLIYVRRQLSNAQRLQKKRLRNKRFFNAIRSKSPVQNPSDSGKKIGLENIEKQFTITKKILIPLLFFPFILFAILPFAEALPTTFITFFVGVATLVAGLAARPLIENVMSGLVISYSRVLNVGDTIMINKSYGTVEDINIFHTVVKIWDWRRFVIPNIKMLQQEFINYSLTDSYYWVSVEFYIAYDVELSLIEEIAISCVEASNYHAHQYEKAKFWVMDMGKDSLKCWIVAWANSASEAWYLQNDIRTGMIKKFQEHQIPTHFNRHKADFSSGIPHNE